MKEDTVVVIIEGVCIGHVKYGVLEDGTRWTHAIIARRDLDELKRQANVVATSDDKVEDIPIKHKNKDGTPWHMFAGHPYAVEMPEPEIEKEAAALPIGQK